MLPTVTGKRRRDPSERQPSTQKRSCQVRMLHNHERINFLKSCKLNGQHDTFVWTEKPANNQVIYSPPKHSSPIREVVIFFSSVKGTRPCETRKSDGSS